jgi:NAD(P)-dependent dehydrogenase (short-subunit alcohol dehydrogenase family)
MPATVYLVSGSNRGIGEPVLSLVLATTVLMLPYLPGLALVKALVARPDVIVFAGTRKPAAAAELQALAKSNKDKFHILKLTSADEADNHAAVEEIKKIAGRLDVVISNAGKSFAGNPIHDF